MLRRHGAVLLEEIERDAVVEINHQEVEEGARRPRSRTSVRKEADLALSLHQTMVWFSSTLIGFSPAQTAIP